MAHSKKAIGSIYWKNEKTWIYGWVTEVVSENDPDIFIRYQTDTMMGLMEPMMKVDFVKQRCYFLTERSANGELNFPEFERKGYPCKINLPK